MSYTNYETMTSSDNESSDVRLGASTAAIERQEAAVERAKQSLENDINSGRSTTNSSTHLFYQEQILEQKKMQYEYQVQTEARRAEMLEMQREAAQIMSTPVAETSNECDITGTSFVDNNVLLDAGEYIGPSSKSLEWKIEQQENSVKRAKERLEQAIKNNSGVLTAMNVVDSEQRVLETMKKQYNTALEAESGIGVREEVFGDAEGEEKRLGSVSHAQWELETAYRQDNKVAIENAKRHLAHEKAKEEAKK